MSRNYHSILNVLSPSFTNTYSLAFDGVDDYVSALIPVEPYNTSAIRSFSVWVKIDTLNTFTPIFGDIGVINLFRYANNFGLRLGRLRWVLEGLNVINACYIETELVDGTGTAPNIGDGNWHHLALYNAVDGNTNRANIVNCKIYLDGVELTNTTENVGSAAIRGFADGNLVMGAGNAGSSSGQVYLNGNLDEFAYFTNYELTQSDVTAIYNSGVPNNLNDLTTPPTAWYRNGDNGSYKSPQWLIPENSNKDKVSNYSFEFDGVDDLFSYPEITFLKGGGSYFSISMWVKVNTSTQRGFWCCRSATPDNIDFYINTSGKLILYLKSSVSGNILATSTSALSNDTWTHIGATFDGTEAEADRIKLYVNGSPFASSSTGTGANLPNGALTNVNYIGSTWQGIKMLGNIDETAIWNTTLSGENMTSIYNSGTPTTLPVTPVAYWKMGEQATFTDNWLVNNSALSNYSTRSFNFDGVDDYISFSSITLSAEFTISAWIKPTNLGSNTSHIISTGTSNSNRIGIYTADTLQIKLGGSNVYLSESGGNDFVQDVWQHVLIVRDNSNNITAFRNGASFGTSVSNSNTGTLDSIFRFNNTTYSSGNLDEVAIWQSDKSSDVATIYSSGTPADLTSLSPVSWWRMGEDATFNTNWSLPDNGSASNTGTSANMTIADLEGDAPNYTGGGLSANMTIEDRVGDAPNSTSNALSYNMTESDRETDVPS